MGRQSWKSAWRGKAFPCQEDDTAPAAADFDSSLPQKTFLKNRYKRKALQNTSVMIGQCV